MTAKVMVMLMVATVCSFHLGREEVDPKVAVGVHAQDVTKIHRGRYVCAEVWSSSKCYRNTSMQ